MTREEFIDIVYDLQRGEFADRLIDAFDEYNNDKWIPVSERMSMIDIYIRDKDSGIVRRVGDDKHDMLTINKHGQLCYYNLQNGGGCRTGEEPQDWYEFVPNEDEYGYATDPREDGE